MTAELSEHWSQEEDQTYSPQESDRTRQYRTYLHESQDLRLKVAPRALTNETGTGYGLTAIPYPLVDRPDEEGSTPDAVQITTVLTFDRCDELAHRFMQLFDGVYDGAGTLLESLEYAALRTGASTSVEIELESYPTDAEPNRDGQE